jgi:putative addiction module component (TIGR02574 family)
MPITLDEIVEETSHLPADVVDRIMMARHGGIAPNVESAWKTEIHRRVEEIRGGKVRGVPLEKSLARARKMLQR